MPVNLLLAVLLFFAVSLAADTGSKPTAFRQAPDRNAAAICGSAAADPRLERARQPAAAHSGRAARCIEALRPAPASAHALAGWRLPGHRG